MTTTAPPELNASDWLEQHTLCLSAYLWGDDRRKDLGIVTVAAMIAALLVTVAVLGWPFVAAQVILTAGVVFYGVASVVVEVKTIRRADSGAVARYHMVRTGVVVQAGNLALLAGFSAFLWLVL